MRLIDANKFEATLRSHIISNNHSAIRLNTNQIANNDAILDCIDWLHKEPTVEERPTGEWILQTYERFNNGNELYKYYCNKCGHKEEHAYSDSKLPNFCPNCGADMQKSGADREVR